MSKYKPGQLVTIGKHVFRIVRKKYPYMPVCKECGLNCGLGRIGMFCNTLPLNCYLKPVK